MRHIRGTVGCLAVALAAMGGCTDSGQQAREAAVPRKPGQQRGALTGGTAELVRDFVPSPPPPWGEYGQTGSEPQDYVWTGKTLFFTAKLDVIHGRELFASDGTRAGTRFLRDIASGNHQDSNPLPLVGFNGSLFFTAHDGSASRLWKSDGTPAGTQLFVPAGTSDFNAGEMEAAGGTLYLSAIESWDGELWKSNGMPEGTVRVKDIHPFGSSNPENLTAVGATLYFTAEDGETGRELWKSDGTPEGTVRVKDITPGSGSTRFGYREPMVAVGNRLYFIADDGQSGTELWVSDGTEGGTRLVKDLSEGSGSSSPTQLTAVGNTLYFAANDGLTGFELWKTDGTPEGTLSVTEPLRPGAGSTDPLELRDVAGTLYFVSPEEMTLWKTDGTPQGTMRADMAAPPVLGKLAVVGSRVYFFARGMSGGYELWRHDTLSGESLALRSFRPWSWDGYNVPYAFASAGDTLFFAAEGDVDGIMIGLEPWKTDGTPEGTVPMADVQGPNHGSYPSSLVDLDGKFLFSASTGSGGKVLWKTDGTEAGTEVVTDTLQSISASYQYQPRVMGGVAYFTGSNGASSDELWRTDGTAAGTWLVKDIEPQSYRGSYPSWFEVLDGKLLFSASTSTAGNTLWVSDGTAAGTRMLKDPNPASADTWGGV